jgi:hypothetical protein
MAIKAALEKDGWVVTDSQLRMKFKSIQKSPASEKSDAGL